MFLGSMLCHFVNISKLWIFTNCSELFAAILRLFGEFSTFFQRFSTKIETMNFAEYCEFTSNSDKKYLPVLKEVRMIHSKAWFISMMTDDYVCLCKKFQNLNKQKEFDGSQYTFEDDEMIVPNEIEKRYVEKKPNKEKVQITVKEPIPVHEKSISKSVPIPEKSFPQSLSPASIKCTSEKPPQKSAHRRNFMDWIVSLLAGE